MLGLFVSISYFLLVSYATVLVQEQQTWIKIEENGFVKDGKPFRFIGASAVNLVFYDDWGLDIEKAIQTAKENNISVLRIYLDWGWSKDEDIDKIIDTASKCGVYLIVTLTDCCCSKDYRSVEKYYGVHAPFCNITNAQSVNAFKKRIRQIINRKNSISHTVYRDEPAILAWEIANELEFWHFAHADVHKWIGDLAKYIKSLDRNHLVTIGINTHRPEFDNESVVYEVFKVPDLDFFSIHLYLSSEISHSANQMPLENYITQLNFRIKKFLSLKKPVIIGEFGFSTAADLNYRVRTSSQEIELYLFVFKKVMDFVFSSGASAAMFWGWGVPEETAVPMWWGKESHSIQDRQLCALIRGYKISLSKNISPKDGDEGK